MQMVTLCLQLHLEHVEFYLQEIKNGFSSFFLWNIGREKQIGMYKTKAEFYDLKCVETTSVIRTGGKIV